MSSKYVVARRWNGANFRDRYRRRKERDNYRLLLSGQTVSLMGTAVTTVAMPALAVLTLNATTLEVALISAAGYLPYSVFALFAGVLVDRWSRRNVLIWSDVARAVIFGSVPLLWSVGLLHVWYLIGAAILAGVFQLFFDTAYQAYLPDVVSRDRLARANSMLMGNMSVTAVSGPGVGGLLIQWLGAPLTLLLDGVSYLVSFVSVIAMKGVREHPSQPQSMRPSLIRGEVAEGLRYVTQDRLLRTMLGAIAHYNVCDAARQALLVLFLFRVVRVSPAAVGFLLAAGGVGAALGAFGAHRLIVRLGTGPAMTLAAVIGPAFGLLLPLTYNDSRLGFFVVASMVLGASETVLKVAGMTYRQATVPRRLLGRVTATNRAITWGPVPLGGILAGLLGELLGVREALLVVAVLTATTPVWIMIWPVWNVRDGAREQARRGTGE